MPINPAVQRQGLNLGPASLTATQGPGFVTPGAVGTDTASVARRAAIGQFLGDALGGFQQSVNAAGARAAVQGALDAQGINDLAAQKDEQVAKQNIFLRDRYENGYTSAAVNRELTEWRNAAGQRAQQAAIDGLSDEEFRTQEGQATAQFTQQLGKWLPSLDEQGAVATLDQIQKASAGNFVAFQEGRARIATQKADAALDANLQASGQEFFAQVQAGSTGAADATLVSGMASILGAQHLDKQGKFDKVRDYLLSVAQNSQDPALIDRIDKIATSQLGINGVEVSKALRSEFNRAGNQMEAQVRFNISDQLEALKTQSPEAQEVGLQRIRSEVQRYGTLGVLSTGTQLDIWNSALKGRDEANDKYAFQTAIQNKQPASVLAGMFDGDVDKARKYINQQFPDTPQGNAQLLQYGKTSKDASIVQSANERASKLMADTLASLDALGEDGTISVENNAAIAAWVQSYQTGGDIDKLSLSSSVPDEYKGIIQRAAAQGQANASNIILDDIRRLARNKASGRYNNLPLKPPEEAIDAESTANWFSFGDTADAQRAEGRVALTEEYTELYYSNPEILVGKSPGDINTLLKGRIQSRQLEVEVAGKPRHIYFPAGTTIRDFQGSYRGDTEQFRTALQQQIQTQVNAVADPSKVERVIVQAGTAGAQSQNLTASVLTKDGLYERISIDTQQVAQLAQAGYDEALAGGIKIGEQAVGARPAAFWDADNGRTLNLNVSGKNSSGLPPAIFSDILSTTMQFEGFRGTKKNGSVGFGLHDNSGLPVPDNLTPADGVRLLKGALEKQYIPAVKKQLSGVTQDASAFKVLVDLNYHGGNGSSSPVADALKQVKSANANKGSYVPGGYGGDPAQLQAVIGLEVLRKQPAYKQAQPARKKYLESNYWQAVQAIKLGQ